MAKSKLQSSGNATSSISQTKRNQTQVSKIKYDNHRSLNEDGGSLDQEKLPIKSDVTTNLSPTYVTMSGRISLKSTPKKSAKDPEGSKTSASAMGDEQYLQYLPQVLLSSASNSTASKMKKQDSNATKMLMGESQTTSPISKSLKRVRSIADKSEEASSKSASFSNSETKKKRESTAASSLKNAGKFSNRISTRGMPSKSAHNSPSAKNIKSDRNRVPPSSISSPSQLSKSKSLTGLSSPVKNDSKKKILKKTAGIRELGSSPPFSLFNESPPKVTKAKLQKGKKKPTVQANVLSMNEKLRKESIVRKKSKNHTETIRKRIKAPAIQAKLSFPLDSSKPSPITQSQTIEDYVSFFAGRLSPEDADISKCIPGKIDIEMYNNVTTIVKKQEEKIKVQPSIYIPPPYPAFTAKSPSRKDKSPKKSKKDKSAGAGNIEIPDPSHNLYHTADVSSLIPKIPTLQIGAFKINTWYAAPYPEEFMRLPTVYLCMYCLKPVKSSFTLDRHMKKCVLRRPPGDEVYRDGAISIFEVDGRKNKIYCQNLCLLAKTFLDHKTLYYDVEPFLFYIMSERDENGCNFVGYFSKEKRSSANFNVSCILTLPIYQRRGYGSFLIDFSYLLSRKEGIPGSPEKPLSDLGLLSYKYYWRNSVIRALVGFTRKKISILDLVGITGMTPEDIARTLTDLNALYKDDDDEYAVRFAPAVYEKEILRLDAKGYLKVKESCLRWQPFIFKRHQMDMKNDQQAVVELLKKVQESPTSLF